MANVLSIDRQVAAVAALVEGSSIRSIERMTGIHRDTVMRLGVRVGEACGKLMGDKMRELPSTKLEIDEIWGFVGKKQRNVTELDGPEAGDIWTFVAIDPDSKAVPAFAIGKRDAATTDIFLADLASRMTNRVLLSSDAMSHYADAVERNFGDEADYGQIIKVYRSMEEIDGQRRYSPPHVDSVKRRVIAGEVHPESICTSIVERQNLTMRMHCRRLTRLTNAFSKKADHFRAAVALHFGYYNFAKVHSTIRCTPAMAVGVSSRIWSVQDLVELAQ